MSATYRVDRSYDWNYTNGPVQDGQIPDVPKTPLKDFLGYKVNSRLGIPAGLLLNANWVEAYANLGFDILTYKTVRSEYRACYDLPNWVFINRDDQMDPNNLGEIQNSRLEHDVASEVPTSSVSFGMPSKSPDEWMPDVSQARQALRQGQVLIVSVVASPQPGSSVSAMVADYGALAAMAREAGAQIIEANLSCPNVCTSEGDVYLDAELSGNVAAALKAGAKELPVLLKLGYFADNEKLAQVLRAVNGKASGVVLVNGISRKVVGADGMAVFGEGREMSGILGRGIHQFSLDNVKAAKDIIARENLSLEVIAVGGVTSADDAAHYFDSGAAGVMMGSAPMFDPTLAIAIKREHPEW